MAKHKWTFASIGNVTRVSIQSGEDIRHLGELDKKLWTVLSCPTSGLEISDESLKLMDVDGDGILRIKDVVATADWLCATLVKPDSLLKNTDTIAIDNIADESIVAVAKKVQPEGNTISLADVDAAIAAISVDAQPVPEAPLAANVIAAYKAKSAEYAAYFEQEKLQQIGLATIAEDAVKPGMTEKKFLEMGAQIAEWEAAKLAVEGDNTAALAAAKAEYAPLRKLLLLHRDFYRLLRNFVSLEDFYCKKATASFQCGTLIIDQRVCNLCIRVTDMGKHALQAPQSGIYLIYCDCESKKMGQKIQIVAAMTQGDVNNLSVGKNAVFYDNAGNDYDATVTKIIDNPISILQAFWTPYRKIGNWITDKINKSAAEKDAKIMTDVTTKLDAKPAEDAAAAADQKPAFDIAKFAGIFAAIGMAVGMIGSALASLAAGLVQLTWWQLILVFVGILLVISGPSMVMAWLKLRCRNLAPVLNANGWAVNADALISVLFGTTLTEQVKYPMIKDPLAKHKKHMKPWQSTLVTILSLAIFVLGIYGVFRYLNPVVEEEVVAEVIVDSVAVVIEEVAQ